MKASTRSAKSWDWALSLDPDNLSPATIRQAYHLDQTGCSANGCKRNCSQKPKCIHALGKTSTLFLLLLMHLRC